MKLRSRYYGLAIFFAVCGLIAYINYFVIGIKNMDYMFLALWFQNITILFTIIAVSHR